MLLLLVFVVIFGCECGYYCVVVDIFFVLVRKVFEIGSDDFGVDDVWIVFFFFVKNGYVVVDVDVVLGWVEDVFVVCECECVVCLEGVGVWVECV